MALMMPRGNKQSDSLVGNFRCFITFKTFPLIVWLKTFTTFFEFNNKGTRY